MISNQKDNAIKIERPRFDTLWATTSKLKIVIKNLLSSYFTSPIGTGVNFDLKDEI